MNRKILCIHPSLVSLNSDTASGLTEMGILLLYFPVLVDVCQGFIYQTYQGVSLAYEHKFRKTDLSNQCDLLVMKLIIFPCVSMAVNSFSRHITPVLENAVDYRSRH